MYEIKSNQFEIFSIDPSTDLSAKKTGHDQKTIFLIN